MQSQELVKLLQPFGKLCDPRAVNPAYRCIELSPRMIRGCAAYGELEQRVQLSIDTTCFVNGAVFIGVVNSLPSGQEVELTAEENFLSWRCGPTSGRLATVGMASSDMPRINHRSRGGWRPQQDFVDALKLGALSADEAQIHENMYGVEVHFDKGQVLSSDSASIAWAQFTPAPRHATPIGTFGPDGIEVLRQVIAPGDGVVEFDEALYYRDQTRQLRINSCTSLSYPAAQLKDRYATIQRVLPLPVQVLHTFINRLNAITQVRRLARVTVSVKQGNMMFSFVEDTSESHEQYAMAGRMPAMAPFSMRAILLARVLPYVDEMGIDYVGAEQKALVFRSTERGFHYLAAGA